MKFLIQRVSHASVDVDGRTVGSIGRGYLVLIGVGSDDTEETADRYIRKMLSLRIFEDSQGKTNLSLSDVGGQLLPQKNLQKLLLQQHRRSYIQRQTADLPSRYQIQQGHRAYSRHHPVQ